MSKVQDSTRTSTIRGRGSLVNPEDREIAAMLQALEHLNPVDMKSMFAEFEAAARSKDVRRLQQTITEWLTNGKLRTNPGSGNQERVSGDADKPVDDDVWIALADAGRVSGRATDEEIGDLMNRYNSTK